MNPNTTQFTEAAQGPEAAWLELESALRQNRLAPRGPGAFGFYPSMPNARVLELQNAIRQHGHDGFSDFAYNGVAEYLDTHLRALGSELFHLDDTNRGGLVLASCTLAIQQMIHVALSRFYAARGHDFLNEGHHPDARPVIITPQDGRFLLERCAVASGLGTKSCHSYLPGELPATLDRVRDSGGNLVMNFMVGGHTTTGLVMPIEETMSQVTDAYTNPLHFLDASAHGFNLWAQDRASEVDFSHPIDALALNPQKAGFPLGGTVLLLRAAGILSAVMREDTDNRLRLQSQAPWLVSRDASSALTFFATLKGEGLGAFRAERLQAVENQRTLRDLLGTRPDRFEILPSDNTVLAFKVRGEGETWALAEKLNAGEGGNFIAYSPGNELQRGDFLWAVTQAHHTQADLKDFFEKLCKE